MPGMSLTYRSIEFGQRAVISETQMQRFGGVESIDIFDFDESAEILDEGRQARSDCSF